MTPTYIPALFSKILISQFLAANLLRLGIQMPSLTPFRNLSSWSCIFVHYWNVLCSEFKAGIESSIHVQPYKIMYAHTHTHTHLHTHTFAHTHMCTHIHTCTHTHMCTHTCTHTCTCTHTRARTHTYACTHVHTHTHMHASMHVTCTHTVLWWLFHQL